MDQLFTEIIEKEFDCLLRDADFVIKEEGNLQNIINCMLKAVGQSEQCEHRLNHANVTKTIEKNIGIETMPYTQKLIDDVKELYPDSPDMHEHAEEGNTILGRILDDSISRSLSLATSLEELQAEARLAKRKLQLYIDWCKQDPRKLLTQYTKHDYKTELLKRHNRNI